MSKKTDIVFILDRSGSMCGFEQSTIKGFNKTLKNQKELEGEIFITTVLFDTQVQVLYKNKPIKKVKELTEKEYYVRGCTALLDAIGISMTDMINKQRKKKSDHVIFVITTDGYENASQEYDYSTIKKLIKKQQEKYGWEFVFTGTRINVEKEAQEIGIPKSHVMYFCEDEEGVNTSYEAIDSYVTSTRLEMPHLQFEEMVLKEKNRKEKLY